MRGVEVEVLGESIWKDGEEYIPVRRSAMEALKQRNVELEGGLAQVFEKTAVLTVRVAELEEKLRVSSRNSSKPPSSDPPGVKENKAKQRTGKLRLRRKRGGQKGHEGKARKLLPPGEVDRFVDCPPTGKCECGGIVVTDEVVEHRQLFELPKVKPQVTEYRVLRGVCDKCGRRHCGKMPAGVPGGMLAPRAGALVAVFSGWTSQYHAYLQEVDQV